MRRQSPWLVPGLVFGALVFTAVLGVLAYLLATDERPSRGGVYTEGIAGSPMALNPLLASFNDPDRDLTTLLFTGLTRLGPDGAVQPDLAEEWKLSDDGRTYTFRLRKNARWHDGHPVSPEDVVYTFRLVQEKDLQASPDIAALWRKVRVEKAGDDAVRFILEQPYSPLLAYAAVGILPEHRLKDVKPKDISTADFNASPVGTGPFHLKEAALDQVTLEANPDFYGGRPYLERIQFKFLRDDQALAAALATKKVDGGLLRPSVGPDALDRVRTNKELTLRTAARASYSILFLNNRGPVFQSKGVRQALAYALDQQRLVRDVASGLGAVAYSPIAPESWAYNPAIRKYEYDPTRAAQLLEENGWKPGATGIREKNGQPLRFTLLTNDDKTRIAIGEELVRSLRRVGVQAEIQASGATGLIQNFLLPRKYDAILYGIDPGADPDPYALWHSSQAADEGLNISAFAQPDVDRLLERARTSANPEERRQLYQQFQSAFAEEVPSILLYHPVYTYAVDRRLRGISLGLLYATSARFLTVRQWYLETQRVLKFP
ncbi:MAG: peptide ABC transporter substrate-binding protein [Chloroflexi bacterium]|nr:peptide ABC transporter substrate-binding protein [Chloroflexota bacterium]